ncbi:MAG TPA: Smr/MutS family protein [Acidobacteriota bacterium]|nr:Smr/MutS family protein [Acidobacteriota bacterium]
MTDTLDLHSFDPKDVKPLVEEYLEQCLQRRFRFIRIIHGKGTGVQKAIVRSVLDRCPYVEAYSDGSDWGSTAVTLNVK